VNLSTNSSIYLNTNDSSKSVLVELFREHGPEVLNLGQWLSAPVQQSVFSISIQYLFITHFASPYVYPAYNSQWSEVLRLVLKNWHDKGKFKRVGSGFGGYLLFIWVSKKKKWKHIVNNMSNIAAEMKERNFTVISTL